MGGQAWGHNGFQISMQSNGLQYLIDTMTVGDWERVQTIYQEGIANGNATFEQNALAWEQWDQGHLQQGRLVAREGDSIVGWAA